MLCCCDRPMTSSSRSTAIRGTPATELSGPPCPLPPETYDTVDGGGVGGRPRVYFALYRQVLPLATHLEHGWLPLHLALRDLQKSHARLTLRALEGGPSPDAEMLCESGEGSDTAELVRLRRRLPGLLRSTAVWVLLIGRLSMAGWVRLSLGGIAWRKCAMDRLTLVVRSSDGKKVQDAEKGDPGGFVAQIRAEALGCRAGEEALWGSSIVCSYGGDAILSVTRMSLKSGPLYQRTKGWLTWRNRLACGRIDASTCTRYDTV